MALQEQSWGAVFQDWGSRALDAAVNKTVNYPYGVRMNQAALMQQYSPQGYFQQGQQGLSATPGAGSIAGIPTGALLLGGAALVVVLLLVR